MTICRAIAVFGENNGSSKNNGMKKIARRNTIRCIAAMLALHSLAAWSADFPDVPPADSAPVILVLASRTGQLGIAESANEGVVTRKQLEARIVYRPAELLETTPGLIVSQHSG